MLNLIFILEKSYIYIFFPEPCLLAGSCVMQSVYNFFIRLPPHLLCRKWQAWTTTSGWEQFCLLSLLLKNIPSPPTPPLVPFGPNIYLHLNTLQYEPLLKILNSVFGDTRLGNLPLPGLGVVFARLTLQLRLQIVQHQGGVLFIYYPGSWV